MDQKLSVIYKVFLKSSEVKMASCFWLGGIIRVSDCYWGSVLFYKTLHNVNCI